MNKRRYSPKKFYLVVALVFIVAVFVYIILMTHYPVYFVWLLATTIVTFILYGYDKFMALNNGGRVPKIILHLLALSGGFVGGWSGMIIWKHKKSQLSFYLILLLATVVHAIILYFYFFPQYNISLN